MRALYFTLLFSLMVLPLSAQAEKYHGPASLIKVEDTNKVSIPGERKWFLGAEYNRDIASKGANGFGVTGGYLFNNIFVNFTAQYVDANYGAINIHHNGVVREVPIGEEGSETARVRRDDDPGTIYMIGPGAGFISKLMKSDHWVEMGSCNISFMQYSDDSIRMLKFIGGVLNMRGGIGYRFGPAIVAPTVTWNLGFVQKVNSSKERASGDERNNYLPLQWWAVGVNLYLWAF